MVDNVPPVSSVSPPAPNSRLSLNHTFNPMYGSIPQPMVSMTDTYKYVWHFYLAYFGQSQYLTISTTLIKDDPSCDRSF